MAKHVAAALVGCIALAAWGTAHARGDLIAFDDQLENGFSFYPTNSAGIVVESTIVHQGTAAFSMTAPSSYAQMGIGGGVKVPADATTLRMSVYFTDNSNPISQFLVQVRSSGYPTVRFDNSNHPNDWTVDGQPGSMSALTPNTWHTVDLNLAGAFTPTQLVPGTTQLNNAVAMISQTGHTVYMDDVAFVSVPEPASLGLLALGAVGLLRRKRR